MNEYVGADALHPPAMSRFYRDDVGIVPYKKMHNLPDKSQFISLQYKTPAQFAQGLFYVILFFRSDPKSSLPKPYRIYRA